MAQPHLRASLWLVPFLKLVACVGLMDTNATGYNPYRAAGSGEDFVWIMESMCLVVLVCFGFADNQTDHRGIM